MGKLRHESVVHTLLNGLQARGRSERVAATRALVQQHSNADKQKRVEIRIAVGRVASDQVLDHLSRMLQSSVVEEREAAVAVLGWTGRVEAVEPLLRAALEERLRDRIYDAILSIGPKGADSLVRLLDALGRAEKTLAIEVLGQFGLASSLSPIVELSLSEESDVADAAQRALGRIGNESVISTLVELLQRESSDSPKGVVASLVMLGIRFHDEVVLAVKPLLEDQRPPVRAAAAEVLCSVAHKSDMEDVSRLVGDEDPDVRIAALRAMGKVGSVEAVEKLRLALTDESPEVRIVAARALGNLYTPEAMATLEVALKDGDPWVVREVVIALGRGGFTDVANSILTFVRHHNGAVALEAVRALNRLGWQDNADKLADAAKHPDAEVVKEVISGCDRWTPDMVRPVLVGALESPHWDVRMAAVKKIGMMRDPVAIQAVYERLGVEKDELVRETMDQILEVKERGSTKE
jgi:HEAT repeat protein